MSGRQGQRDASVATRPKARISAEEMARRREAVRWADAHNRIEGLYRHPETDAIFEAFVRGDIEAADLVPHLKAQLPRPVPERGEIFTHGARDHQHEQRRREAPREPPSVPQQSQHDEDERDNC